MTTTTKYYKSSVSAWLRRTTQEEGMYSWHPVYPKWMRSAFLSFDDLKTNSKGIITEISETEAKQLYPEAFE